MKNVYALLLCFLLSFPLFAQKGWDLGVTGIFTNTYIWRQDNYGTLAAFENPVIRRAELAYKATWGGNGGIELGYNFTKNWGVKIGAQYSSMGQNYEDNFDGPAYIPEPVGSPSTRVNVKRTIRLGYTVFPVLAKYLSKKARVAKFFACLGPQFGARTYGYEQVVIAGKVYLPDSVNYSVNQKFQRFDAGIDLQFGTDVYATNHLYFEFGLNGYCGIADINGEILKKLGWYDKNHVSYQQSHNTSAGLMVGMHYIFSKKWEQYQLHPEKNL